MNLYSDSVWFWRISEGVPNTKMKAWKSKLSEEDRWKLVLFERNFGLKGKEWDPAKKEWVPRRCGAGSGGSPAGRERRLRLPPGERRLLPPEASNISIFVGDGRIMKNPWRQSLLVVLGSSLLCVRGGGLCPESRAPPRLNFPIREIGRVSGSSPNFIFCLPGSFSERPSLS